MSKQTDLLNLTDAITANGTALKVDTIQTAAGGVPTASDLGINVAGSVLQVVYGATTSGGVTTTSTSFVDSGVSLSITPSSSTSKVLVNCNLHVYISQAAASVWNAANFRILRGGTQVFKTSGTPSSGYTLGALYVSTSDRFMAVVPLAYLDTPSSTAVTTYTIQLATKGTGQVHINAAYGYSTMTLQEIAG